MGDVIAIQGNPGTGKSSFILSFVGKVLIFDLEFGAKRATNRYVDKEFDIWQPPLILEQMYAVRGDMVLGKIELWKQITEEYVKALQSGQYIAIGFDTHKELWSTCSRAELQRKQEIQMAEKRKVIPGGSNLPADQVVAQITDLRQSLQAMEYAAPNEQMKAVIDACRVFPATHLVLVNHLRDIYAPTVKDGKQVTLPTGQKEADGWSHTLDLTDWGLSASMNPPMRGIDGAVTREAQFFAEIIKSPSGAGMLGLKVENPTYAKLMTLSQAFRV